MPQYHFFYGGPFSQWYPCVFELSLPTQLHTLTEFNCAEQYMMAAKALHFGDEATFTEIMETTHPRKQKALGRQVKGFDVERWNEVAQAIVYVANVAKFSQSEYLKKYILDTNDDILVEASDTDRIWGIGLSMTDNRRFDPALWEGTNWLGEALMQARTTIRALTA